MKQWNERDPWSDYAKFNYRYALGFMVGLMVVVGIIIVTRLW